MQLVDGHLHGCFREHLRAHVEYQTRLDYVSRHVCDRLVQLTEVSGFVLFLLVTMHWLAAAAAAAAVLCRCFELRRFLQATVWCYFCHRPLFEWLASWRHLTRAYIRQISRRVRFCAAFRYSGKKTGCWDMDGQRFFFFFLHNKHDGYISNFTSRTPVILQNGLYSFCRTYTLVHVVVVFVCFLLCFDAVVQSTDKPSNMTR